MMRGRVVSLIRGATTFSPSRRESISAKSTSMIPHVGRLPPETFVDIIRYLVFPNLPQALLFLHSASGIDVSTDVWSLVEIQTALRRVTLVCRAWNVIGTELLYTYPCFVSSRQVRNFSRSIKNSPSLARFIKHIFVVEADNLSIRKDRKRIEAGEAARAILQACKDTSLETLTTDVSNANGSGSIASFFIQCLSVATRLRRLVINGTSHPVTFAHLALPNLEVLCLRTSYISSDTTFPILPQLHTLQIAKSDIWVELGEVILEQKLPKLRSLELYQCEYAEKTFHPLRLPYLERMHFIGEGELALYKHLLISGALDKLKHVTLGFIDTFSSPPDLSETPLPLMLQSLTLLGFLARNAGLISITRYLEKNMEVLPANHFRRLEFSCTKIDCDGKTIHGLQTLCTSLGIEFQMNKTQANTWISERLACW